MTEAPDGGAYRAALVPELYVSDPSAASRFYVDTLGFGVGFARPEDGFLYLELGRAQIMLEELSNDPDATWRTGLLAPPFGRGINFQIEVADVAGLHRRAMEAGLALFRPLQDAWYREGAVENGQSQFLIQDPDGYLLRFVQVLGVRPLPET